ncbi:PEP-CTERM sorting domain-containing protein [Dapis sp. BLCC M229]|uniref:PEP-CTERM sorting domain-containing protein n=1 Tax=Dapis sp. BLCC M229 TaxID=3400188 RepID=UPI003CEF1411
MRKFLFSQKFAPLGVAALSAIAATSIATAPVQAATVSNGDTAGWGNGTDDFYAGVGNDNFSVDLNNGAFLLFPSGTGIFEDFDFPEILPPAQFPITMNFTKIGGTGAVTDPFKYTLDNNVIFNLGISGDAVAPITYTQIAGSQFDFIKDAVITEGELDLNSNQNGFYTIDGVNYQANETFQLSDLATIGPGGEYDVEAEISSVPEPGTILGLLAVGGLGLGMKRKKQQ